MKSNAPPAHSQLHATLPHHDFREYHFRLVNAPPHRVYDAIRTVTPGDMPLVPLLLKLRSLPASLTGKEGLPGESDNPLLTQMLAGRFTLLAEDPGREMVVGLVGQMWKPTGGLVKIRDVAAFLSFNRRGYVRVAMNMRVEGHEGGTLLSTETRVLARDRAARWRFAAYWMLIRAGSGLIRRSWLRAIAMRAERGGST